MKKNKIKVEASILSADFSNLKGEIKKLENAGVDGLHLDIMDGHFVPNISFGPAVVATINRHTKLFLDVHLMIYNPFDYVEKFVEAGADRITFHLESTENIEEVLKYIRSCNVLCGLAINPETSGELLLKYADRCDSFLFMSVNPGFGGQKFLTDVAKKIKNFKDAYKYFKKGKEPAIEIQVDGGINETTGKICVEAGATTLISGSYLFSAKDIKSALDLLKGL